MLIGRILLVVLSLLATGLSAQPEGAPTHETPLASRAIPLALGSVDAISGNMALRVPLGPRLPGRISIGFTWSYDNQDSMQSGSAAASGLGLGGNFRPVVWPSPGNFGDSPLQSTVVVDGRSWVFYRNHTSSTMPSLADLGKALQDRHVTPTSAAGDPALVVVTGAIPSSDGTRFLVALSITSYQSRTTRLGGLTVVSTTRPGYAVLDGPNAIWTMFPVATGAGSVVTHFTNLWGDHVTVEERSTSIATDFSILSSIVITDQVAPSNSVTLAVVPVGDPATTRWDARDPLGYSFGSYPKRLEGYSAITVTNTLGLPLASLSGHLRTEQRFVPLTPSTCPGYAGPSAPVPEGLWDHGLFPSSIIHTAGGQVVETVAIAWSQLWGGSAVGADTYGDPVALLHASGLKETFTYGPVVRLSQYSYNPCTGYWQGFRYLSGIPDAAGCRDNPLTPFSGVLKICRLDTRNPGTADQSVLILRTQPTWEGVSTPQGTHWFPIVRESQTAVLRYPTGDPAQGGPFRAVRLTHPTYLDGMDVAGGTGYLLATAAVLFEEELTGSGICSDPRRLVGDIYRVTVHDGYDFRNWANPTGNLASGLPVNPVPLRTTVYTRDQPTRTTVAGNPIIPASRDAHGPIRTDEYIDFPRSFPVVDGSRVPIPADSLPVTEGGAIHRLGVIQRDPAFSQGSPQNTLMRLLLRTDQKSLDGPALPSLRFAVPASGASAPTAGIPATDFGVTTYSYDALGRIARQQGDRAGYASAENRTYLPGLPLLSETMVDATAGPGGPYYANPDFPTLVAGKRFTWADTHLQAGPSTVTDKLDGRQESYTYSAVTGLETGYTDRLGVQTFTSYDPWGRVSEVTRAAKGSVGPYTKSYTCDPAGTWKEEVVTSDQQYLRTRTDHDAFGRPTQITTWDDQGEATRQSFRYDGFGQKVYQEIPRVRCQAAVGGISWSYDAQGRLSKQIDARGKVVLEMVQAPTWGPGPGEAAGLVALWSISRDGRGYTRAEGLDLLG